MAITVVKTAGGMEVTFDGATEWDITSTTLNGIDSTERANGVSVQSIEVIPGAADDILTVRDGGAAGRRILRMKADGDTDDRIKYFNHDAFGVKLFKLYVKAAEVTSGVVILVEF